MLHVVEEGLVTPMTRRDLTEAPQRGEQALPGGQAATVVEDVDFDVLDRVYGVSTEAPRKSKPVNPAD